ncbi:MAG: nitroreductase family protein [Pseudomonadota bacterium]
MSTKASSPSFETEALREFGEVLKGRRTINLYLQTRVPEQLVTDAIEAATWAPNHHVTEPWRFYRMGPASVASTIERVRELVAKEKGQELADFKAKSWAEKPGWLTVTCRRSEDPLLEREDYAACSVAVQNFMLYLWKAGVGSKWTSGAITRDPVFLEILGVDPEREFVVGMLWYGYPKITPTQSRAAVEDVTVDLP